MIILKHLDFINSESQESRLIFENVIFRMDEIKCSELTSSLVFNNCIFEQGLKIEGLSSSGYIHFKKCKFANQTGLFLSKCELLNLSINDCFISGNESDYLKLFSGILSQTILIKNSNIESVIINNSNFNFESHNSHFTRKFTFYIYELESIQKDNQLKEFGLYFGSTTFKRATIDIRVPQIKVLSFEQTDDENCQLPMLQIHEAGMVNIKSDLIQSVMIKNISFTYSYIDFENVPIQSFNAANSNLGQVFNFKITRFMDDEKRRVIDLKIVESVLGESHFIGREFDNRLDFTNTFFIYPPIFYETKIPEGSIFPGEFYFDFTYDDNKLVDSINAFRHLRKVMEDRRDRDKEGQFYLLEQTTQARLDKIEGNNNYFRMLYGFFSDYGTDYFKPLVTLLVSTIMFTIYYAMLLSPSIRGDLPIDWDLLGRSLHFSIKQVVLPFWSIKDLTPLYDKNVQTSLILFISFVQSLISSISIALSILALRWKFKRG